MAANRVFGSVEFEREFGRQHAAVRSEPVENQFCAFVGKQPVYGIAPGPLHVVSLCVDLVVRLESSISDHNVSQTSEREEIFLMPVSRG
jgi:hypothetical protein